MAKKGKAKSAKGKPVAAAAAASSQGGVFGAVQFVQKLKEKRSAHHGTTEAESEALRAGLKDEHLDLPVDVLSGEDLEQMDAAAAAEWGMGAMWPLDEDELLVAGAATASANQVGLDVGLRAAQFGVRLLQRRAEQRDLETQMDKALPIGLAQLDYLGMLERTATATRADELLEGMDPPLDDDLAALLPTSSGLPEFSRQSSALSRELSGLPGLSRQSSALSREFSLSAIAGIPLPSWLNTEPPVPAVPPKPARPPASKPSKPLPASAKRARKQRAPPKTEPRSPAVPPQPSGPPPAASRAVQDMQKEILERQNSAPVVFIEFNGRSIELRKSELKKCPNIPAMLRKRLKVPARGKLRLRSNLLLDPRVPPVVIEVPITGELPPRKYILDTGPEYTLHFLQEPPHGVAHWLQCWAVGPKSNLTLTHTFTPPVEVTVLHNGELMEPKEACKLLEKGVKWRLLRDNVGMLIDVTEEDIMSKGATEFGLIRQSKNELANLQPPADQRHGEVGIREHDGCQVGSVLFKELGIAGVSAKYLSKREAAAAREQAKAAKEDAKEQGEGAGAKTASAARQKKKTKDKAKAVGHSGRGASDYYLLEVSLEGVATEILQDHSTGEPAQICIKNNRLKTKVKETIGWEEQGIGPYADHSECVPSHICDLGRAKCKPMPMTPAGAAAAKAKSSDKPMAKSKRKASAANETSQTKAVGTVPVEPEPQDGSVRLTRASSKRQKVEVASSSSEHGAALTRHSSSRTRSNRQ